MPGDQRGAEQDLSRHGDMLAWLGIFLSGVALGVLIGGLL